MEEFDNRIHVVRRYILRKVGEVSGDVLDVLLRELRQALVELRRRLRRERGRQLRHAGEQALQEVTLEQRVEFLTATHFLLVYL